MTNVSEAVRLITPTNPSGNVTLTLAKSSSSTLNGQHLQEEPFASTKTVSTATSPIKDTIKGSQEFVKKLISGSSSQFKDYKDPRYAAGIVSSSSSEKVYFGKLSGSNSGGGSGNPVYPKGPFGLMETVKEKFDNVRGRKRSKEPNEMKVKEYNTDGEAIENNEEMAIQELDNVLNYHSCSSGGTKSSSSKKKRSKDSFKSGGGTWPRTRCGPVIDHGTGTILHPQKVKKERLPLVELLAGVPKYPQEKQVVHRNDDVLSRSTREPRRGRPATTYGTGIYRHLDIPPPPHLTREHSR